MNTIIREIARAWHDYQDEVARLDRTPGTSRDAYLNLEGHWASGILDALKSSDPDPDLMWQCVLEIWNQTDKGDEGRVGAVAAGPMENLIDAHGPHVIDRIEAKAKEDPEFRRMLLGVWPPVDEDRADWQRIVKLVEDLGPVQSFKDRKKR